MLRIITTVLLGFAVLAQQPEPYPGQNQHAEPPAGWVCQHQNYELSVPPDHACACERGCDEQGVLHEDKQCKVYCHADHCTCQIAHKDLCPGEAPK
jgi:hypothetical protein